MEFDLDLSFSDHKIRDIDPDVLGFNPFTQFITTDHDSLLLAEIKKQSQFKRLSTESDKAGFLQRPELGRKSIMFRKRSGSAFGGVNMGSSGGSSGADGQPD